MAKQEETSAEQPYLSFLHKRVRSHKKKLEKIKGLETAQACDGKKLNAQQLELVGSKSVLEKLVAELETLREQFIELQPPEELPEVVEEPQEMETQQEPPQELPNPQQEPQDPFANVYELLKTLHVVNLHLALGKEVPMVLDFFEKVLLGNTRPPAELSYEENLAESMEEAKKYLTGSEKVFACDTTYVELRAFVDQLATGKNEEEAAEDIEETEEVETPAVPEEINSLPQINFFTESQLEQEQDQQKQEEETQLVEAHQAVDVVNEEVSEQEVVVEGHVEVEVETPPAPESVPAPPLSFAAVAGGVSNERTPSPAASASSGSSGREKKEPAGGTAKNNQRRRGHGRWREKGSNSSNGDKTGDGSPTTGGKPRRNRGPRANGDNADAQGGKKEGRRPRVDRALRKQGNNHQQHEAPMLAPHA